MNLPIVKWGHSAAIRLPATLLAQLGVKAGDAFEADVSKDKLVLRVDKSESSRRSVVFQDGIPSGEGGYLLCTDQGVVLEAKVDALGKITGVTFENGSVVPFEIDSARIVAWALCIAAAS